MFIWTCANGHPPVGYNGDGSKCPVCAVKKEADERVDAGVRIRAHMNELADRRVAVLEERIEFLKALVEKYQIELGI